MHPGVPRSLVLLGLVLILGFSSAAVVVSRPNNTSRPRPSRSYGAGVSLLTSNALDISSRKSGLTSATDGDQLGANDGKTSSLSQFVLGPSRPTMEPEPGMQAYMDPYPKYKKYRHRRGGDDYDEHDDDDEYSKYKKYRHRKGGDDYDEHDDDDEYSKYKKYRHRKGGDDDDEHDDDEYSKYKYRNKAKHRAIHEVYKKHLRASFLA